MSGGAEKELLKSVSRSFYLSLRLLPAPMRRSASLAYMLARLSDTIADSATVKWQVRTALLEDFAKSIETGEAMPKFSPEIISGIPHEGEQLLMEKGEFLISELRNLPILEEELVKRVLETIISGQLLDLSRFVNAGKDSVISLKSEEELEDYTWRVAGCVGEFWTRLGFLTLGEKYSHEDETALVKLGISYGKGLQLVNILRDLPEDLAGGRCYLPVADGSDEIERMAEHGRWLKKAINYVSDGEIYAKALKSRRLRVASGLPAGIALETLEMMKGRTFSELENRIKVPRKRTYQMLIRLWFLR